MNKLFILSCVLAIFATSARAQESAKNESAKPQTPTLETAEAVDEIEYADDAALESKAPKVTKAEGRNAESLVDIECDEATLADIVRQFRKTTSANIIAGDSTNLKRRVSVSLKRVPWADGLESILKSRGFQLQKSDDIYRVVEDLQITPISTKTFSLNHASAVELADLFNLSYGKKDKNGKLVHAIANAFEGANVVVVTADDKTLDECGKIVSAVDKAVKQIYIEARFIEVSNEALHKLGMQWDQLSSWGASVKSLNGGMEYNAGHTQPWVGAPAAGATGAGRGIGGETQESKPNNIVDWRNARGFSGQLSFDDFRLAMSAFEKIEDAKIFSNPKIIVSNGKKAHVDMTTKFPNVKIQASRNTSNGSDSLDISTQLEVIPGEDKLLFAKEAFFCWGISLSVKPRISPDGLISVEIIPQVSQLNKALVLDDQQRPTGFVQVKGGDSSAMSFYPIIDVKRLTTEFTMQDGATAVIGGLSKTEEEDIDSGIPFLRKIPWIGQTLFGWKSRVKLQKEIVIFVTLGIANPAELPENIGLPTNAVFGREYVNKTKLEPGFRDGDAAEALKLEMCPIEDRKELKKGEVSISPAKKLPPKKAPEKVTTEKSESISAPAPASAPAQTAERANDIDLKKLDTVYNPPAPQTK